MFPKAVSGRLLHIAKEFANENLTVEFYLAGGSALAFQLNHRYSDDLDYFTLTKPDISKLKRYVLSKKGVVTVEEPHTLIGEIDRVKVSFFHLPYGLLEPVLFLENIRLAGLKDILCMKLSAVSQRAEKKDFYDLYELLRKVPVENYTQLLYDKYGEEVINTNHVLRSLFYFEEAEESDTPKSLNGTTWSMVKKYLIAHRQEIEKKFFGE